MTSPVSRGFRGRPREFPVLSAGPTPRIPLESWDFTLRGPGGRTARWTWDEFQALPRVAVTTDIHCVTKWSKRGTVWEGVSVDTLLAEARSRGVEPAPYVLAR
jgi:DMSO/TMAO reductase YedYZ molybdopterin-dependent catalytic subunit